MNSYDYLYRPVSYTPGRVSVDHDGRVRLVMAGRDPGVHNWLDTQGFAQGVLEFRTLREPSGPRLDTQLVRLDELEGALPDGTAHTTPEERVAQMWERFRAIERQRMAV
jgi:hypothetical protein